MLLLYEWDHPVTCYCDLLLFLWPSSLDIFLRSVVPVQSSIARHSFDFSLGSLQLLSSFVRSGELQALDM